MCNCGDSATQEDDLAEDLVVDGETFVCVNIMLSGIHLGGADVACFISKRSCCF